MKAGMPHFAVGHAPITSCSMAIAWPFGIKPDLDLLVGQRTGVIHLHVVLSGIDVLDRLADRLGCRELRYVLVRFKTAPDSAALEMLMDHVFVGIESGYRSRDQRGAWC